MADVKEYSVSINFKTKNTEKTQSDVAKVQNSIGKLSGMVKGFAIGAAFKKLGSTIFSLTSKTSDYIETINLFRASMGDATNQAQEFIDKAEKLLGLDPKNLMDSFSQFYNLANGFGIASDRAYTMSQNLTQLAGDMSSFANISVEEAQRKLMSGFSGQVMPLRQYGIALDQATLQEKAYALGLDMKVKEMSRAQKSELIYYQIMSSTQQMQGDLGRSLISPANSVRVMQQEFKALARAVGSIFIPIMMKIIPVVRAVTELLTEAAKAIARFFGFEMGDFNADLSSVGNLLSGVSDGIGDVGDSAESTAKKMQKMLMPFDELNNITMPDSSGAGAGAGIGAGGGGLGLDLPTYDMFESLGGAADQVEKIKQKILELKPLLITIGALMTAAFVGVKIGETVMWLSDFKEALEKIAPNIGGLTGALRILSGLALTIGGAIAYVSGILDIINPNVSFLEGLLKSIGGAIALVVGALLLFNPVVAIITGVVAAIGILGATIYRFRDNIADFFTKKVPEFFKSLGQKIKELPGQIGYAIGFALGTVVKFVTQDIPEAIQTFFTTILPQWISNIDRFFHEDVPAAFNAFIDWLKELPANLFEIGKNILQGLIDGVKSMFSNIWNAIKDFIKGFIDGFKNGLGIHSPSTVFADIGINIIKGLWEGVKNTWELFKNKLLDALRWINEKIVTPVKNFFTDLNTNIKNIWNTITTNIGNAVNNIRDKIGNAFQTAYNNIKNIFTNIGSFFTGIWNGIKNTFSELGTKIGDAISGSVKSGINGVLGMIEGVVNKFVRMINGAIDMINNIPNVNIGKLSELKLPRLAKGGMPKEGQMFIANEAGPELVGNIGNRTAVANQNQIVEAVAKGVYDAVVSAMSQSDSSSNPYLVVNIGDEKVYQGYTRYRDEQSNMYGINV